MIKEIVMEIDGKEFKLSLNQAKELQVELNDLFREPLVTIYPYYPSVPNYHIPTVPNYPQWT